MAARVGTLGARSLIPAIMPAYEKPSNEKLLKGCRSRTLVSGVETAMMHKTFKITCRLSPHAASERLASLLSREGVRFSAVDLQIASTRTPFAIFGFQPKLYTRKNWVGLNPFAFITSVCANFESGDGAIGTRVQLRVNRRRSILFAAFWILCGFLAGQAMPQPAGAILVAAVVVTAWFGNVSFLGGYLVKKEIDDELKTES